MALIIPLAIGAGLGLAADKAVKERHGSWKALGEKVKQDANKVGKQMGDDFSAGVKALKEEIPNKKEVKSGLNSARVALYKGLDAGVRRLNRTLKEGIKAI